MGNLPDHDRLDSLLDAALAGTFPASDPTASFVCERERPHSPQSAPSAGARDCTVTPHARAALLVERSAVPQARKFAASLPANWRGVIERWVAESSAFLLVIDLPTRRLVGTLDSVADVRAMIDTARTDDRDAILHLKFICTQVTAAAIIDDPAVAAVDWTEPPA